MDERQAAMAGMLAPPNERQVTPYQKSLAEKLMVVAPAHDQPIADPYLLGATLSPLGSAPQIPEQQMASSELENLRKIIQQDAKTKRQPIPRKEINPVDALEELRRLIRENS